MTTYSQSLLPFRIIAVEGIDAAGKSTLIPALVRSISDGACERRIVGAGEFGSALGEILRKSLPNLTWLEKVHWFAADRASVIEQLRADPIWDDTEHGLVIWDRYVHSAFAYRLAEARLSGMDDEEALAVVQSVNAVFPDPALTLYMDIPVNISKERRPTEHQTPEKLTQVSIAYAEILEEVQGVVRIDATADPGTVLREATRAVVDHCPGKR